MKPILIAFWILCGASWCLADHGSGPNRSTIRKYSWGSLYYESGSMGPTQLEPTNDGYRFTSNQGEVAITTVDVSDCRLTWGKESLTIHANFSDLDIQGQDKSWTLRLKNGQCTLVSSAPKDTLVFDRTASTNAFSIKGAKGLVSVTKEFQTLRIQSPAGTTTVVTDFGKRTISGIAPDQVPYLGRGLFISFHGVGIFVDIARIFPMPEVAEWIEWKPILVP